MLVLHVRSSGSVLRLTACYQMLVVGAAMSQAACGVEAVDTPKWPGTGCQLAEQAQAEHRIHLPYP